jgi:ComEC/Rec2-related protein
VNGPILSIALLLGIWLGWPALALSPVLLLGVVAARKRSIRSRLSPGLLGLVVAVLALGAIRSATLPPTPPVPWADDADRFEGVVTSAVRTDSTWQRFDLHVERVRVANKWQDANVTIAVTAPRYPDLGFGDRIGMVGSLDPNPDLPPSYGRYLDNRGISGSAFSYAIWIEKPGTGIRRSLLDLADEMTLHVRTAVPGDAGVFLAGLLTGDDTALSDAREERFVRTGTSHLTAVSGANVMILVSILATAGGLVGSSRSFLLQLSTIAVVWTYATMTGLETPVVRAALMVTLAITARRLGRRPDYFTAILLSAAIIAFLDPRDLRSVSFGLSFSASFALAATLQNRSARGLPEALMTAVAASAIAQLATLPVTLATFGTIALASLPANALIGPLVGLAFPLTFAASVLGLMWPSVGDALAVIAGSCADLVLRIVDRFGTIDRLLISIPPLSSEVVFIIAIVTAFVLLLISNDGARWLRRVGRTPPRRSPPSGTGDTPDSCRRVRAVPPTRLR